jgi:hypothetical protein
MLLEIGYDIRLEFMSYRIGTLFNRFLGVATSLVLVVALALLSGCRHARPSALERGEARRHANTLLAILSAWTGPIEAEPELAVFQSKLENSVLTPSHVYGDDSGWTGETETERLLEVRGSVTSQGYRLNRAIDPRSTWLPGEYHSRVSLEQLSKHEFEWRFLDELVLGTIPLDTFSRVFETVLREAESAHPDLKAQCAAAMPRATQVLGRLYDVERMEREHLPDGSTTLTLEARMKPERIENDFPNYARYLKKFVKSVEMSVVAYELSGPRLWTFNFDDLVLSIRVRTKDGRLVPVEGAPRPLPDEFRVTSDLAVKSGPFRIGFRNLVTDVTLLREPNERGFIAAAQERPNWRIPFFLDPFVKGALERPFEGEGMVMRLALEGSDDEPTRIKSGFRMVVKETWLMRRMGGRDGRELHDEAEQDMSRFQHEALEAVHADILALLDGSRSSMNTLEN